MSDPPRRKRLQIHLSTAILLMLVADGLLWANLRDRFVEKIDTFYAGNLMITYERRAAGWPAHIRTRTCRVVTNGQGRVLQDGITHQTWAYHAIPIDALATLGILIPGWFLCEWLIRLLASRKKF